MNIRTALHTTPPGAQISPYASTEAQKWAKYAWSWLATGDIRNPIGNTVGTLDYSKHVAFGDQIRAINPAHQMGWYIGGAAGQWLSNPLYPMLQDRHILHAPDGRPLAGPVTPPNGDPAKLINLHDPATQQDIADFLVATLKANRWSGLLIDSFTELGYITWVTNYFNCPTGCLEGPAHTQAWWEQAMGQFGDRLTWSCEQQGLKVYGIGLAPALNDPTRAWAGVGAAAMAKHLSGLMFEAPHATMGNPTYLEQSLAATKLVTDQGKDLFWSVSPMLDNTIPQEAPFRDTFQTYHLACYLLIQERGTTYGYWPYEAYRGWKWDGTPYTHWDDRWSNVADLGAPLVPYECQIPAGGKLWLRRYARGVVLVNCTNVNLIYTGRPSVSYRLWDRFTGQVITADTLGRVTVPPYAGWVLWTG